MVTNAFIKNVSVVQKIITILLKLLFRYGQKSRDVWKISITDQRMFTFHRDFWVCDLVDRQQSFGTKFLERYSSMYVFLYL